MIAPIDFTIMGNPPTRTAQQKGVSVIHGHVHYYEKKEVRLAKQIMINKFKMFAPPTPIEGPVQIFIEWRFGLKKCKKVEFKVTRPDLDNLEKSCLDCLTECRYWKDDSQIAVKTSIKTQAPDGEGYLHIRIESLREDAV